MKKKESLKLGSTMFSSAWLFCISTASYNSLNKAKNLLDISKQMLLFENFINKSEDNFYVSTPLPCEYYFRTQNFINEWGYLTIQPKNSLELFLEFNH